MRAGWLWVVNGVLAIGVGLSLWYTTFILVPVGVVLIAVGATKFVRTHTESGSLDRR